MSHSIVVTRTTTTSSATAVILNTGILKTAPGLLKLFETIIGAVCVGLLAHYSFHSQIGYNGYSEHIYFFLVAFAFLVTTFLLLVSFLASLMAATIIPKSLFEFLYHLFALIFYLSASLAFIVDVSNRNKRYKTATYEAQMAAAVLGLINAVLYLLSTIFSFRSYRAG